MPPPPRTLPQPRPARSAVHSWAPCAPSPGFHPLCTPLPSPPPSPQVDFRREGEWPAYGNDDERVDGIARDLVAAFHDKLAAQHTYRASVPTLSVLTITSE